jgi:hypothetical protein
MFAHTAEFPVAAGRPRTRSWAVRWIDGFYLLSIALVICASGIAYAVRTTASTPLLVPAGVVADFGLRSSHNRSYRAEVVSASPLKVGAAQQWIVSLSRRNHRRLASARVTARTWMPETNEEPSRQPTATYVGGGRYVVSNVLFTRPGWWNVALVVDGPAGIDSLAFNVTVQ